MEKTPQARAVMRHRMKRVCGVALAVGPVAIIVFLGRFGAIGECTASYPPLEVESLTGMGYFSSDYYKAREEFRNAVEAADATTDETIPHPYSKPAQDQALSTDVALFGSKAAEEFLVIISGTHGVEGFAGSAIQTGLLREEVVNNPPDGIGVLLIHALNPYGMAYGRRFDEKNIDLNRNFRNHSESHPENPHYVKLASAIGPKSVSFCSEVRSWARLLCYKSIHGDAALQGAISQGQYSHPEGLFYGGTSDTWSNATLRSITDRYLSHARSVVVIDIHTGLGAFGDYEIILNDPVESDVFRRAAGVWGQARLKSTIPRGAMSAASASAHVTGSLKCGITANLRAEVTAVSLEFGTLPPTRVLKALRAENWLHHHGDVNHPKAQAIKECLLHAFYPDSEPWKASVWNQGRDVVEKLLIWLKDN